MFHACYVDGRHSATRIQPELLDLKVGDLVPDGAGAYATVTQLEPNRHLVAGEAFILRPLPSDQTRLIMPERVMGYVGAVGANAPLVTRCTTT